MSNDGQDHSEKPVDPTLTRTQEMVVGQLERIGNYRIFRKLGEGGCGIVFEAEQQSPRRLVALKVLRSERQLSEQHIRLFEREAQTLARLHHPGIADIYEIDRTQEGLPFFTMELVRGLPLLEYIRKRSCDFTTPLTRDEVQWRLELFLQICVAINYAHQQGVIHRDLKPSNILVINDEWSSSGSNSGHPNSQGLIKVLDFGLARMTGSDLNVATMVTEVGQLKGTLFYMSPEQTLGDSHTIDVRTDIYSLGIILHEMLVGALPYNVTGALMPEVINVIREEEPNRLSSINKILGGDVETIAGKCLEKMPAHRYQSVAAIIDDINRHLSDQPILARPPSISYQLRKTFARHRTPFIFAGSTFILLLAFSVTMLFMLQEQKREQSRADREQKKVEQINLALEKASDGIQTDLQPTGSTEPTKPVQHQPEMDTAGQKMTPTITALTSTGADLPQENEGWSDSTGQEMSIRQTDSPESGAGQTNRKSGPLAQHSGPPPNKQESEEKSGPLPTSETTGKSADALVFAATTKFKGQAEIKIILGKNQEAENLLLDSYPILMMSSIEKIDKRNATARMVDFYMGWGKPAKAEKFRTILSQIDSGNASQPVQEMVLKIDF